MFAAGFLNTGCRNLGKLVLRFLGPLLHPALPGIQPRTTKPWSLLFVLKPVSERVMSQPEGGEIAATSLGESVIASKYHISMI